MRFTEPAYPTVYFSDKIFVKCPSCGEIGIIKTQMGNTIIPFPQGSISTFHCTKCNLKKNTNEKWYGYWQGFIGRPCGICGSEIHHSTKPTKEPYESTSVKCDACNKEKNYKLKWYRYKENQAIDPYFGMDLWLQTDIKNNILWLYNLEHLRYLKKYISAKLREDDQRHKYSMITNLPQWVKSAKNRDLILKKLERFEKEIIKWNK